MEITGDKIRQYIEFYEISPALFARFINEPVADVLAWMRGVPITDGAMQKIAKQINIQEECSNIITARKR